MTLLKQAFFILLLLNPIFAANSKSKELKLMAYNVENLFDTRHDKGKNDWAFTAKGIPGKIEACNRMQNPYYKKSCLQSDWTPEKLKIKLEQIKRVVLADNGKLPEILALSEIENENVVKMLAEVLGYDSQVVSESKDKRGIDLAILYNSKSSLQKLNVIEHELRGSEFKSKPTRNILEVEFLIGGKHKLNVFVNHWPSLRNPNKNRIIAAKTLASRIKEIIKQDRSRNILAVGDFNTIPTNYPHPFNSILLKDNLMFDLHTLYDQREKNKKFKRSRKDDTRPIQNGLRMGRPLGTYFYAKNMTWNLLDRIFLNGNLLDRKSLDVAVSSYKIEATNYNTRTFFYDRRGQYNYGTSIVGTPKRYNFNTLDSESAGFSDHFPVSVILRY